MLHSSQIRRGLEYTNNGGIIRLSVKVGDAVITVFFSGVSFRRLASYCVRGVLFVCVIIKAVSVLLEQTRILPPIEN